MVPENDAEKAEADEQNNHGTFSGAGLGVLWGRRKESAAQP